MGRAHFYEDKSMMGCLIVSLLCSTAVTILCFVAGYSGTGIVFGVISFFLLLGTIETVQEQAQEMAEAAEPESVREENLLRPNCTWWSAEPIPSGSAVKVHITGVYSYHNGWRFTDAHTQFHRHDPPGKYNPHQQLYVDNLPDPAVPFRKAEHLHEYDFLYYGTGNRMRLQLKTPAPEYYNDGLSVSIQQLDASDRQLLGLNDPEDERRREEEAAVAERERREREAREVAERRRQRLRTLEARYNKADLAWRSDETARLRYATELRQDLLCRRKDIIEAFEAFHRDSDLIDTLHADHADWYGKIDEVFYFAMLCVAEGLPREPVRDRPSPTPDERREQELSWSRVKTKDYRERAKLRLAEERDFIEELQRDYPNLTDGELQQELQRFRDEGLEMPQRRTSDRAPGVPNGLPQGRVL
jgi:hypothetical protein